MAITESQLPTNGTHTNGDAKEYTVQAEALRIFRESLLTNKSLQLPAEIQEFASTVSFDETVSKDPVLPCPLKMQETIAALWALISTISNLICKKRYGIEQKAVVNSEMATLFLVSSAVVRVDGKTLQDPGLARRYLKYDKGNSTQVYRRLATNVYPTKDGKWFHLHGSMNATPTLTMLGLPTDRPELSEAEAIEVYINEVRKWNSEDIDQAAAEKFHQAGTICLKPEEFPLHPQGKAIADHGLYVLEKMASASDSSSSSSSSPIPWPQSSSTNAKHRPLEGIKILDVSRVIAAPTIAKVAALFGATVVRISCDTNPDMGPLLIDGNMGKRDVTLDLKSDAGKAALRELTKDADVFLDGYRPGAMERLGFGPEAVREIAASHGNKNGIVYVRENCYGWSGPFAHRSGWQQISDCITGVSYAHGKFLGLPNDEAVVPMIPNSDYQTGLIGAIGIMAALLRRSSEGGSYTLSIALNYYNMFLLAQGEHTDAVKTQLREKYAGTPVMGLRHYDDMPQLVGKTMASLFAKSPHIFNPKYFQHMPARLAGAPEEGKAETVTFVGPVAKFDTTKLEYDVGTCFLGQDEAVWP